MKKIKVMSVFSGVGGLEQGLDKEKFDVVGHSEINKSACLILNYHYPDIKNYGDITKLNKENLPDFDMLVGGSPCFRAGTLIHTKKGFKKIEDVKENDELLTHTLKFKKVLKRMVNHTTQINKITAFGLTDLFLTEGHPLYVVNKNEDGSFSEPFWIAAGEITNNHYLLKPNLEYQENIELIEFDYTKEDKYITIQVNSNESLKTDELVYNFEVEDDNSYVANNIIAHNCQNLSMAGNKKGLAGSKSGLFFTFARLLEEKQPEYFIWENVKGTFYSNNGLDFFSVLQHFNKLGYHIQWQLLNAEDFGVAQVRNRVFVFGAKNKEDLPGLIDVVNQSKTKNKSLKFSHFCGSLIKEGLVQTITASYGALSGNGTKIIEDLDPTKENLKKIIDSKEENDKVRLLTHNEAEKLMGWGKDWTKFGKKEDGSIVEISERERYRAIGNGIVSNCIKVLTDNFDFSKKEFEKNMSIEDMSNYMINGVDDKKDIEAYKMMLRNLKLIENIDYIIKGKRLYILNFKFVNELLNNEKLKKTVLNLKHPLKGMLDINNEYIKTKQHIYKSLKNTTKLSNFLDKGKKNKKYLSKKECEYIYSKIK